MMPKTVLSDYFGGKWRPAVVLSQLEKNLLDYLIPDVFN